MGRNQVKYNQLTYFNSYQLSSTKMVVLILQVVGGSFVNVFGDRAQG